ncbi:MAG: hypothetical protein HN341_03405 [Verrucomicrobia bacterium]|jgi:hypothetical protein|nr:hypothetical protein [Verrucomicrobiota bacterium]
MTKNTALRLAGLIALGVLTVASFTGFLEPGLDAVFGNRLQARNDAYLEQAFNNAITGFGVMSVWKAGLDIIEGSEVGANVGVSARLQVGDVVQPAYDYVDIAWRTMFLGSVSLLGLRYLLQAAELVDAYVLTFTLAMLTLAYIGTWLLPTKTRLRTMLRDVVGVGIVASLALFYMLPLSVWGAAKLSGIITAPSVKEASAGFDQARLQLFPEASISTDNWVMKLRDIPERIEQIGTYLKTRSTEMITWTVKLVAGYIFDCIVFPVAIFVMLLWLTRGVLKYVLHRNMQRSLRDDIRAALGAPLLPSPAPEIEPSPEPDHT